MTFLDSKNPNSEILRPCPHVKKLLIEYEAVKKNSNLKLYCY